MARCKKLVLVIAIWLCTYCLYACGDNEKTKAVESAKESVKQSSESVETESKVEETEASSDTEVGNATESQTIVHEHEYTSEITIDPTCDTKGVMTYTCSCGDVYTEETGYLDHCTDRSAITKEATCEEEGIETFYCIFCDREIYTEKIAKLPHTESCNHESVETPMDPEDYTFTQCIKILYVVGPTSLYSIPCEGYEYAEIEYGTAIPVVSKCDQADFYRTPYGMTISGKNLSEERPTEYAPGGEEGWENFVEETPEGSKYTYWSGTYRANGLEVRADYLNKPYVERHIMYAKEGLYKLLYRESNSSTWSGAYEIIIEKTSGYFTDSQYIQWVEAYVESKGLIPSVSAVDTLAMYRMSDGEGAERLLCVTVSVAR